MGYYIIRENEEFVIESQRDLLKITCKLGFIKIEKCQRN
jgi:hypothetical protein